VIYNATDEALADVCKHIAVTLHDDGSVSVDDANERAPWSLNS